MIYDRDERWLLFSLIKSVEIAANMKVEDKQL